MQCSLWTSLSKGFAQRNHHAQPVRPLSRGLDSRLASVTSLYVVTTSREHCFRKSKASRFSSSPSCGSQVYHLQIALALMSVDPRVAVLPPGCAHTCGRRHMRPSLLTSTATPCSGNSSFPGVSLGHVQGKSTVLILAKRK